MNTPQDFSNLPELTAAPGFAERLRQASAITGYDTGRGWQQRIADELGVKNQAIGQWMRGETLPSSSMMLKIAQRFNVALDWLLLNRGCSTGQSDPRPLDLTNPAALRDQAASLDLGDWITHASDDDLRTAACALETVFLQMNSERAARQWRNQVAPWLSAARGVVA